MSLIVPLAFACLLDYELALQDWQPFRSETAAQIQVESSWRPNARSRFAAGLAQFTPATWGDWSPRTDPSCAGEPATDPACSIRSQIRYMRWLLKRERGSWNEAWRAYNGGPGWIDRERRAALAAGLDPRNPLALERMCEAVGRSKANCRENLAYPKKIRALIP